MDGLDIVGLDIRLSGLEISIDPHEPKLRCPRSFILYKIVFLPKLSIYRLHTKGNETSETTVRNLYRLYHLCSLILLWVTLYKQLYARMDYVG